jgi:hypothetical protein
MKKEKKLKTGVIVGNTGSIKCAQVVHVVSIGDNLKEYITTRASEIIAINNNRRLDS